MLLAIVLHHSAAERRLLQPVVVVEQRAWHDFVLVRSRRAAALLLSLWRVVFPDFLVHLKLVMTVLHCDVGNEGHAPDRRGAEAKAVTAALVAGRVTRRRRG